MEAEEGGHRSIRSVTFIIHLELDCDKADTVPEAEEGNRNAENTRIDVENGVENLSTDLQLPTKLSASPNIEGAFLHHSSAPPELPPHLTGPESATSEEVPAGPSEPEHLIDEPPICPQRRAILRQ